MRILLINDYFEGGGAEAVFREQFEILRKDFEVEMFYAFKFISDKKISPISYIYSFRFKKKIEALLNKNRFDCVIVHNYNSALSPSVLDALNSYKKKNKCKIIYYAHDYHLVCPNRGYNYFINGKRYNFTNPPGLYDILTKKLDDKGLVYSLLKKIQWILAYSIGNKQNVFDLILAPSDFLKEQIKLSYPKMKIERMYNVCNSLSSIKQSRIKEKSAVLRLVYFGRLDPIKGLVNFIDAIRHSSVDYFFTIIGEGEDFSNIKNIIEKYGLQDKIVMKPKQNQEELFAGLADHDVLALPSLLYENAPLCVIEAASLGLGLFLSNHGGILEMGKICNAVHFFDPFDANDIVSKLEILYKDFIDDAMPKADNNKLQALFSRETYITNLNKYLIAG